MLNEGIRESAGAEAHRTGALVGDMGEILAITDATRDGVGQIAGRIKNIQGEASVVMVNINASTERVVEQSDRVNNAGTAFLGIAEYTQEIAMLNEGIRESAGAEAHRTGALTETMGEILAVTDTTRDSVGMIAEAMTQLIDLAHSLREQITQFALEQNLAVVELPQTAVRLPHAGPLDAQ